MLTVSIVVRIEMVRDPIVVVIVIQMVGHAIAIRIEHGARILLCIFPWHGFWIAAFVHADHVPSRFGIRWSWPDLPGNERGGDAAHLRFIVTQVVRELRDRLGQIVQVSSS
jgi:hypothetical protein